MKRLAATLALSFALGLAGALLAPAANAEFGLKEVDMRFTDPHGAPSLQAGSHPFAQTTTIRMNTTQFPKGGACEFELCSLPDGATQDLTVSLPPGFVGDPLAVPRCSMADFIETEEGGGGSCPDATVLGFNALQFAFELIDAGDDDFLNTPVYSLHPPPGVAARLGFYAISVPVTVDITLNPEPPHNVIAHATNIAQAAFFYASILTLWGDPYSPAHDEERGDCLGEGKKCPVQGEGRPFLTLPRSCTGPLKSTFEALSWPSWTLDGEGKLVPGPPERDSKEALIEPGTVDCAKLGFEARVSAQPTADAAESPSGLDFDLQIDDEGLTNPSEEATALSDVRKAVVTLPEGVTVNPSQAEGLAVCSEAQLAEETLESEFGAGCPPASKIGNVEVESQLLEGEVFKGSLFVAEPYNNRFGSLLAIYQVIRHRELGLIVKLAGKVEPDPETGQLITTFDDLPQLPFSDFRLHFREGGRSPLVTPPACGTYETKATFTPWANPDAPFTTTASFQITKGVGGGPCPQGGTPPFEPGFSAGTANNNAGSYSPFHLRLQRRDGDQDLVRFDAKLPEGAVAKLAGVSKCSDQAIASLKGKTGTQELASPSCPANSKIGSVWAGAGVGSQLTYVPGSVYLAGPFAGAPLSVVGVVPAVAGPFDVGVVFTRQALSLDPVTGQPQVDGSLSEPIPHILAGIPLKVRDIQVNVDRPDFTLNPTSCAEKQTQAQIWGGGANPFSLLDDSPVARSARFQAANCQNLGFKPRLSLKLKGGTKRGGHPALRAVLRPRPGDANLRSTVVKLPRSAFLDQAHIRTICTRVQFAQDACPPGSIYGKVKAFTPLLEEPLTGPAYLRSSNNNLPDLVFALKGVVEIEASARIDSVGGGIRATFAQVPDAPVSKVVVEMQGAKKGLIVNSRDLCAKPSRAEVRLGAHNGKRAKLRPVMRVRCGAKKR